MKYGCLYRKNWLKQIAIGTISHACGVVVARKYEKIKTLTISDIASLITMPTQLQLSRDAIQSIYGTHIYH